MRTQNVGTHVTNNHPWLFKATADKPDRSPQTECIYPAHCFRFHGQIIFPDFEEKSISVIHRVYRLRGEEVLRLPGVLAQDENEFPSISDPQGSKEDRQYTGNKTLRTHWFILSDL